MFSINKLVRNVGSTYKSIYANGNPLSDKATKALRDKYVGIEKRVYAYGQHSAGVDPTCDLAIVYHGIGWGCLSGNNAHLEFDERYPVIHFISYDTDVADLNIKTGFCYEGKTYSATTSKQMGDFNCLFDVTYNAIIDKYTGIIRHFVVVKKGHTPILDLTDNSSVLDLIDTLAQFPLLDKLFMMIDKAKCFKYQKKQMAESVVGFVSNIGNIYENGFDVYEYGLYNGVNKAFQVHILKALNHALDTAKVDLPNVMGSFDFTDKRLGKAVMDLYINKYVVGQNLNGDDLYSERNLGKSMVILSKCLKSILESKVTVNE